MARKNERKIYGMAMIRLAGMIADALEAGQRDDGTTKSWTDKEFGNAVGVSEYTVKDWRNRESPNRPTRKVGAILDAFYGTRPEYSDQRAAMYDALIAAGCEDDDPPEPGNIPSSKKFSDIVSVVSLLINQVEVNNRSGKIDVPFTLRFLRGHSVEVRFRHNGKLITRSVDFHLEKPLFMVSSDHWQPVQTAVFRKGAEGAQKVQQHYRLSDAEEDCVEITGPIVEGRLCGDPFEDVYSVTMETRGTGANGPIKFSVEVPPEGVRVTLPGDPLSLTQQDVVNAIVASKIPRGRKKRLVIATAAVTPGMRKGDV